MPKLPTIKKRADFLFIAKHGQKVACKGLVLQCIFKEPWEETSPFRVGFTTSGRLGCAVIRNRIRRRLRAVAERILPLHAKPGFDYVIIGRHSALDRPMDGLEKDLKFALHTTGAFCPAEKGEDDASV